MDGDHARAAPALRPLPPQGGGGFGLAALRHRGSLAAALAPPPSPAGLVGGRRTAPQLRSACTRNAWPASGSRSTATGSAACGCACPMPPLRPGGPMGLRPAACSRGVPRSAAWPGLRVACGLRPHRARCAPPLRHALAALRAPASAVAAAMRCGLRPRGFAPRRVRPCCSAALRTAGGSTRPQILRGAGAAPDSRRSGNPRRDAGNGLRKSHPHGQGEQRTARLWDAVVVADFPRRCSHAAAMLSRCCRFTCAAELPADSLRSPRKVPYEVPLHDV